MPLPSRLDSSKMLALLRLQYEAENWEAALNQRQTDTQEIFRRHLRRCSYRDRGKHELKIQDCRTSFNLAKHSKRFPGRNHACDNRRSCLWSQWHLPDLNSGHLPLGACNISLEACQLEAISGYLISLFCKRVERVYIYHLVSGKGFE